MIIFRNLNTLVITLCLVGTALAHEGPDPVAHWQFNQFHLDGQRLKARLGPDGNFSGSARVEKDELGESIYFNGRGVDCLLVKDIASLQTGMLPTQDITVAAWVAVDQAEEYGGIIGTFQDNGDAEQGWVLGYRNQKFSFGLATEGADDGDGKMTYLEADRPFELGRFYFVVGVYDGQQMELYVNGKLANRTESQSGPILYPEHAPWTIGAYHDRNERIPMKGRIREIAIYDLTAKSDWVAQEFEHQQNVAALQSAILNTAEDFVVKPFLQYGTTDGMTIVWQTAKACQGKVHWGEDESCQQVASTSEAKSINQIRLNDLQPETQYFYYVESENAEGQVIESEVRTFQTACRAETPFAFAVISDTQDNPEVSGSVAELAWAQRPHFLLHPGDLVGQGKKDSDWTQEYFSSMEPLISRVPFYPVLGNHEQNAQNYFDYMALPDPEYYYQFRYGNSDFFMIDSNRKIGPDSEQYQWLDQALAKSDANWKFVCHHHPPFSSDENDYGNLWKTNKSTRGDLRARQLVELYEKHHVDIVWNGHIHSYERTWPLREQQATDPQNGTMYMITGGGGGGLETPGPYRPYFQHTVRRGHHYVMVMINGNTLQMKAYDLQDQLFDTVQVVKTESRSNEVSKSPQSDPSSD